MYAWINISGNIFNFYNKPINFCFSKNDISWMVEVIQCLLQSHPMMLYKLSLLSLPPLSLSGFHVGGIFKWLLFFECSLIRLGHRGSVCQVVPTQEWASLKLMGCWAIHAMKRESVYWDCSITTERNLPACFLKAFWEL